MQNTNPWNAPLAGLVCRPALALDRPAMLALTSQIWDGNDYLPQVWDSWLLDSVGRLVVAELRGRLVGLGKLTCLAPGQWWVEGLRVHPELQGLGIASHLHEYLLQAWSQLGSGVLRLATSAKRLPIHHLCYRTGFQKLAEFTAFRAPSLNEQPAQFTLLRESELDSAMRLAVTSPSVAFAGGLWDLGWEWAEPTLSFLQRAAAQGLAFWWDGRRGLLVLRIDEDEDDPLSPVPVVQILACSPEDLPKLLQDYRRLAAGMGYRQAAWVAGLASDLQAYLDLAGFERTWDSSLYIFEKR